MPKVDKTQCMFHVVCVQLMPFFLYADFSSATTFVSYLCLCVSLIAFLSLFMNIFLALINFLPFFITHGLLFRNTDLFLGIVIFTQNDM